MGLIPGLVQWVKDPALLWLWRGPVATAPIQPLAWEPPSAVGVALKSKKKKITIVIWAAFRQKQRLISEDGNL